MADQVHPPQPDPDPKDAVTLPWRAYWRFAEEDTGANGCIALAFVLALIAVLAYLWTRPSSHDAEPVSGVLADLVNGPAFTWTWIVSGALACCAAVCAIVSWRRHVIHPLAELTRQLADEPTNADLYWGRGWIYLYETGLAERAIAEFTRAIELEPNAWSLYDDRADAYSDAGNSEQAILDRTRAIAILAENGELAAEHWWLYAERSFDRARLGDDARIIADVTEALRLAAQDDDIPRCLQAILLYRRALAHQRSGEQASADRDFREAHRYDRFWIFEPRRRRHVPRMIWGAAAAGGLFAVLSYLLSARP